MIKNHFEAKSIIFDCLPNTESCWYILAESIFTGLLLETEKKI